MDIVLIAGLWLPSSIWDDVCTALEGLGHRALPAALPGVDVGSASATLADQVDAVLDVVDQASRPVIVGHSAACGIAWMVADARPDSIERVVLVGGFPPADGETYADFFPIVDGAMAFPGWEPFEGPDSADLGDTERGLIAESAVPVPEGVAKGTVRLSDERRFDVPVVMVCPEYGPDDARAWVQAGDVPELARANRVAYVDIDSGHWPMVTRPEELARTLASPTEQG